MLEQAVIDAQALKEAAIKNAEQEVLEKYAVEIKEAVNSLLEQEDPFAADPMAADPMAAPTMPGEEPAEEVDPILDEIPLKATEDLREAGEQTEQIELDLDSLKKELSPTTETEVGLEGVGDIPPMEPPAPGAIFEASNADLEKLLEEDPSISSEEEVELDEESVKNAIEEILKVDLKNVPRGTIGTTHPTGLEQIYAVEVAAAADQDTERKEQNKEFDEAVKKIQNLEEQVKSLKSEKNGLVSEHKELKSIARQISDKLTELNTTNAKLVYQNRILKSHSLNERQKNKLVEAVSNANSTEEAKVIYKTLQESLISKDQSGPRNLSEAVSKNNRLVLKSNRKEPQVSSSASERMKKLAGII